MRVLRKQECSERTRILSYYKDITNRRMQEARGLGLQVFAWTPDSRSKMRLLIEKQVAGIITNRPEILKDLIRGD